MDPAPPDLPPHRAGVAEDVGLAGKIAGAMAAGEVALAGYRGLMQTSSSAGPSRPKPAPLTRAEMVKSSLFIRS